MRQNSLGSEFPVPGYDDTLLQGNDPGLGAISYHTGRDAQVYVCSHLRPMHHL